jgi:hypothetical protein
MTSMRKTITETMIMAMAMARATMINTSSQATAEEPVHAGHIHRRIRATLRNKDIMIMAGPEVVEIQDHKEMAAEGVGQITGDHQQRMAVEVVAEEATQTVMGGP